MIRLESFDVNDKNCFKLKFTAINNYKLVVFLIGRSIAMATYSVKKCFMACPSIIGHLFDTIVKAITYKDWC